MFLHYLISAGHLLLLSTSYNEASSLRMWPVWSKIPCLCSIGITDSYHTKPALPWMLGKTLTPEPPLSSPGCVFFSQCLLHSSIVSMETCWQWALQCFMRITMWTRPCDGTTEQLPEFSCRWHWCFLDRELFKRWAGSVRCALWKYPSILGD